MNKRQRKKQNTYSIKKSEIYRAWKRVINFHAGKSDKKINNKIRWKVLEKIHFQEEKSRWKEEIKNMHKNRLYSFRPGKIEIKEAFECKWGDE